MVRTRCNTHRSQPTKLLQVEEDRALGLVVQREITYNLTTGLPVRRGWTRLRISSLGVGVYCSLCLAEGRRSPLDLDPIEHELLGRTAFYFPPPEEVQVQAIWSGLGRRVQKNVVAYNDLPERPAIYGRPAAPLPVPVLVSLRQLHGNHDLYLHQAKAIDLAEAGKHVVVSTPTASGKSLCYVVPVLARLLRDPDATAIYVAPTQALAQDQFDHWIEFSSTRHDYEARARANEEWHFAREIKIGGETILAVRYDGGTEAADSGNTARLRRNLRAMNPRIIITTPEMLHTGILAHGDSKWKRLFANLAYIVVDELHVYKGIFGANFAQILTRTRRTCHRLGAVPTFIACSATIRNPGELGSALLGVEPIVIGPSDDGSPRRQRRFVIIDSTRAEEPVQATARHLQVELMRNHRLRTICFTRSIAEADGLYRQARETLSESGMEELLCEFKALLPAADKRTITRNLQNGRLAGVISTNALELGVDIGTLSAALIVKFPGSISSLFQQSGRVGRKGAGLVFVLADENPLNQFFVQHPEQFFAMTPEEVYVDPDHAYVVRDHLTCAALEDPLDPEEDQVYWGPDLPNLIAQQVDSGKLKADGAGKYIPADGEFFSTEVGLRHVGYFQVPIMHQGQEITKESGDRAARVLHRFARVQLQNATFEVANLRINYQTRSGRADVRMVPTPDYVTASFVRERSDIKEIAVERPCGPLGLTWGTITLTSEVLAYYQIPIGRRARDEERTFHMLGGSAPPPRTLPTKAVWFGLPGKVARELQLERLPAGLRSMQKALSLAACIHLRCDPGDLDGLEMVDSRQIFLYDTQAGGTGLSAKVFEHFAQIWVKAWELLQDCPYCSTHSDSRGCPKCVTEQYGQEESIDRRVALQLFDYLGRLG